MDPITKESLSGSWVDSSPEEAASQDHMWARPHKHVHLHTLPGTQSRPPTDPKASWSAMRLPSRPPTHTASSLEGSG